MDFRKFEDLIQEKIQNLNNEAGECQWRAKILKKEVRLTNTCFEDSGAPYFRIFEERTKDGQYLNIDNGEEMINTLIVGEGPCDDGPIDECITRAIEDAEYHLNVRGSRP